MLVAAIIALSLAIVGCGANSSNVQQSSSTTQESEGTANTSEEATQVGTEITAGQDASQKRMDALYGENKQITDDNYDKSLAVKCVNGTFVGKKTDGTVSYKGIPFVGEQPTGEHRWKAPVEYTADDGVYEAYYFGKVPRQVGNASQEGSLYPQGEDCLYLNVWKADDESTENKPVMVWTHGGAYEIGGTAEPRQEGANFVKEKEPDYTGDHLFDQLVFIAPLIRMSENQTMGGGKSYTYLFTPESSIPLIKCGHALELSTVFNRPEENQYTGRLFDETFSKTLRRMWVQFAKTGNQSLTAELSPDGTAKEWPAYDLDNKWIMVFDEFNIHPEKESERMLLDWDRTYFLTKYYCIG